MQSRLIHPAEQYANDVLSGRVVAGNYIKLACQRYERDIEHGHRRGLWHDAESAQYVIDFFSLLTPSKGDIDTFELMPWEQFSLWNLFGWKKGDGYRRFKQGWLEIARKNGKSAIGTGCGLYMLSADGERGAEVYSAGIDRLQSRVVFDEAVAMVDACPDLQEEIFKSGQQMKNVQRLVHPESKSFFEPCSRDAKKKQGYNVHCAVLDEVHVHEDNGEMWDAMRFGMRFRKQPLLLGLTTAGEPGKPTLCSKKHEMAVKMLEGVVEDDGLFALIFALDPDDDWEDERVWPKANPSLGNFLTLETIRQEALEAKNDPGSLNSFKRYALNMWVDADKQRIPTPLWDACLSDTAGNAKSREVALAELMKGRRCLAGLDLAVTTDITALIILFFPTPEDPHWRFLPFFYVPKNNIAERSKRDHVPYLDWERDGFLIATPGDTTDYSFLCEKIMELKETYDLIELAYDPAHATPLINQLQERGFPASQQVKFAGALNMSYPTKELVRLVLRKEILHTGNPVMRWMNSNMVTKKLPTGLEYPDKERSTEKIDGMTALISALGRATHSDNVQRPKKEFKILFPTQ